MKTILELSGIHQHVNGRHVLADIRLAIPEEGWLLICGQNGAGKTLLIRLMAGLDAPSAGTIRLLDQEFERFSAGTLKTWRRHIGVVLQGESLIANLSVLENLLLPLRDEPRGRADLERATRLMIALFQLDGLENLLPHELSLGQRRQVALARALVHKPKLLLWDGCSDGLDPALIADCLRKLGEMRLDHGRRLTLIATDNSASLPVTLKHRVAVLDGGRLLFVGQPEALRTAIERTPGLGQAAGLKYPHPLNGVLP
jgi:ABC-type sulfate/molybdate transport systems ATPase subunit